MTSKQPPSVSPAALAPAIKASCAAVSVAPPIETTREATAIPQASSNCRHKAPTATRAAVSRALARSRMSRTSARSYFWQPPRSACPGRGAVTAGPVGSPKAAIFVSQFTQSALTTRKLTGLPSVSPNRTPDNISAQSRSIFIRPPRPNPSCRRAISWFSFASSSGKPAGNPSTIAVRHGPCDSPAVKNLNITTPPTFLATMLHQVKPNQTP